MIETERLSKRLFVLPATSTAWAQAGSALALWMLLPLLIGTWRITRREAAS